MIGLDTNVLVRYLTQDHKAQSESATRAIERAITKQQQLHINHIVLCELVWVLSGPYEFSKATILDTLDQILSTKQFEFEEKDDVHRALAAFRMGRADFSDALIAAKNLRAGCDTTLTFDKKAAQLAGFKIVNE